MNKKRIALALAAGLSINALVVTVGQVGGQVQVAHATQSKVVPGTENEKKVNAIEIKTLTTKVTGVDSKTGDVTLSVDKTNLQNVAGTLTGKTFTNQSITGNVTVSLNSDGTLKVKGIKDAGVYTGDIELIYKDGSKEKYALTVKKTDAQKVLSLGTVEVGVGKIAIDNVTYGGQAVTTGSLKLVEKGQTTPIDTIKTIGTDKEFTVFDLKEGIYQVIYNDGTGDVATTEISVVKAETPEVKVIENKATSEDIFTAGKAVIGADYGLAAASVTQDPVALGTGGDQTVTIKLDINGTDKNLVSYVQTVGTTNANLGGAKVSTSQDASNKNKFTVTVGEFNLDNAAPNFIPGDQIVLKSSGAVTESYLVGEQYVSINGGTPQVYYNGGSSVSLTVEKDNATKSALKITGGKSITNGALAAAENAAYDITLDTSSFKHGYTPVSIEFKAQATNAVQLDGKNKSQLNTLIDSSNAVDIVATSYANPVKTALIVSKNELDGFSVNVTFEKISDKSGVMTILNGKALGDPNQLPNNLTVDNGSNTGKVGAVSVNGNDLVVDVTFTNPISGNIEWKHTNGMSGTIDYAATETLNFNGQVQTSNKDAENLAENFYITAQLDSTLPVEAGTVITLKDSKNNSVGTFTDGRALVNLKNLSSGSYIVEADVKNGKYAGIYKAGLVISTQPMGLKVEATSTVNNRIDVNVDADFFKTDDTKNVTNAKLVYNKVGETTVKEVSLKDQVKEDKVPVTLTVDAGKYEIKAVYDYKDANGKTTQVVSNVVTVEVKGNTNIGNNNNGSGIVSGGSGSTTTPGNSVGSTTITSTSSNTTSDSDTVNITLPSGVNYDSNKTPVAVKFIYKGLDGKTVTETKEQYSNVVARFENGKVVVDGLVPGKEYTEISVDYTDNNGRTRTLVLKDVKTTATKDLDKYLADVYTTIFARPADEAGYHFHLKNLGDKKTSLREFLLNLLTDKEFGENYKTPSAKIDGLYAAIVARTPDQAGKDFWVAEYNKAVKTYGSEALALQAIADRMVNEPELKTLAEKMNVQW